MKDTKTSDSKHENNQISEQSNNNVKKAWQSPEIEILSVPDLTRGGAVAGGIEAGVYSVS